jgi:2-polyprenyl-3-methyl-5-hydroxy-6-metoxy-1,4-benzoquinol methylase
MKKNEIRYTEEQLKSKANKLELMANSILNNPLYKNEIEELLNKLNLTKKEVIQAYVNYDLDIFSYSNEIYTPLVMRMVLYLHNILEGSWHIERQNNICKFIELISPSSIIDVGFGVPTNYIKKALENKNIQITLTDIEESAFKFAETLLDIWDPKWKDSLSIICEDMIKTSKNPPLSSVYLFQDSIEHVLNPTKCLTDFVTNTEQNTKFILSLPIGQITPIHYIAWNSNEEVIKWLKECGLQIMESKQIHVNPHVDLFAEQHNFDYSNYVVLCKKI